MCVVTTIRKNNRDKNRGNETQGEGRKTCYVARLLRRRRERKRDKERIKTKGEKQSNGEEATGRVCLCVLLTVKEKLRK